MPQTGLVALSIVQILALLDCVQHISLVEVLSVLELLRISFGTPFEMT